MRAPFTEAEDEFVIANYSSMKLKDMAVQLERGWGSVQQRIDLLIKARKLKRDGRYYRRPWTEEEETYLAENWGVVSTKSIARHLGRSSDALKIRTTRVLKIAKKDNVYTMRQTARIFGVDDKTPLRWAERGWLKCKRAGYHCGGGIAWNFSHESIERFIVKMGWAYDWRRMGNEGYFRHLAEKINMADPWLMLPEVCEYLGWSRAKADRWRRRGLIPYKWRPKQQQHGNQTGIVVVRKRDLADVKECVAAAVHANRSASAKKRIRKHGNPRWKKAA